MKFEQWRREVNITLMDKLGSSLAMLDSYMETEVKNMYEAGDDPIDAVQYVLIETGCGEDLG